MGSRERGGIVAGILITLLVVTVLAVVAAVGTGLYLARNVRVTREEGRRGERVEVETPFGSVRVRKSDGADARRLGVPVYPGARPVDDDRKLATVELDLGDEHKEFTVLKVEYETPDSVDKVAEYYRRELPSWTVTRKRRGSVQIEMGRDGHKRIVAIREKHGRTHIAVAGFGEPVSN